MFDVRCSAFLALFLLLACSARAELLIPLAPGTTWEYARTGTEPAEVTVRVAGSELSGAKQLFKLETRAGSVLTRIELVTLNERGLLSHSRTDADGNTRSFDPPQTLLPANLKIGTTWEFLDEVAGAETLQQFSVVAEENLAVPAGTFRAFRLRADEPWPISVARERWFAPGTGFIKEITTTRGPTGRLISRVALSLKKFHIAAPPPEATPLARPTPLSLPTATITLQVAKEPDGEPQTDFPSDAANIFVRWRGENLPVNAYVRIAWIAEDVGDLVEKNFIVDENETEVATPDFGARFTLSRPKDGWAPGTYRVELYLDEELIDTVQVTIRD